MTLVSEVYNQKDQLAKHLQHATSSQKAHVATSGLLSWKSQIKHFSSRVI